MERVMMERVMMERVMMHGAGDAGIINQVGLGMIAVFAMVAASANAVLF